MMNFMKMVSLKIRKLIRNDELNSMNDLELRVWISFVDVVKNFSGNRRTENYNKLMEKLLKSLQDIGANMRFIFYKAI